MATLAEGLKAVACSHPLDPKSTQIPQQCQWFSLRVAKGWLTNDRREARREANRHRLESGSDFEQDVSSEDYVADPESPDKGAGAGDSWGMAGGEAVGDDQGGSDDSLCLDSPLLSWLRRYFRCCQEVSC